MSDQGRLVAGRYRLTELIGRGGMGTVWRADDELLGRQVAVKKLRVPPQLHDDERERLYERTRREARSAARIAHPNVVVVHDVVEDEGLFDRVFGQRRSVGGQAQVVVHSGTPEWACDHSPPAPGDVI